MAPSGSSEKGTLEIGFDIIDEGKNLINNLIFQSFLET